MSYDTLFSNATRLPSIPKIIQELIKSFDDPDANVDKIASKIAQEPVLTAKLLRVANSAFYGLPRQVSSVQDACIVMGFPAVRTLVMASAMVDSLEVPTTLNKKQFWLDAFGVAGCAKWLAQKTKSLDQNTAFTAGLLHSIGQLLMYSADSAKAGDVKQAIKDGKNRVMAEMAIYGYNHAEVGAELARRWKFPKIIHDALQYQYTPSEAGEYSKISAMLCLSKFLVNAHNDQPSQQELEASIPQKICDLAGLSVSAIASSLAEVESFSGGIETLLEA